MLDEVAGRILLACIEDLHGRARDPAVELRRLDGARDQSCIRCGRKDGSVVAAHYFGLHRSQLGGGMGHKVDDIYVADLCAQCHEEFDRYRQSNDYERATEFLLMILFTIRRRAQQGLITIKGAK